MHLLGHFYSGRSSEEGILAAYISETVNQAPEKIQFNQYHSEIRFHIELNSFSRSNPHHLKSQEKLKFINQKFRPMVIDLFYDHFLAVNWEALAKNNLPEFEFQVQNIIQKNISILPNKSRILYNSFIKKNKLSSFKTIAGVHSFFYQKNRFKTWPKQFENVFTEFSDLYNEFQQDFELYIQDIDRFTENYFPEKKQAPL